MAGITFNGTAIAIGVTGQTPLTSIRYSEKCAKVGPLQGVAGAKKTYVAGIPEHECTFTLVGGTSNAIATSGAVTITWSDASTTALGTCKVSAVEISGSEDNPIATSITVRPSAAS